MNTLLIIVKEDYYADEQNLISKPSFTGVLQPLRIGGSYPSEFLGCLEAPISWNFEMKEVPISLNFGLFILKMHF